MFSYRGRRFGFFFDPSKKNPGWNLNNVTTVLSTSSPNHSLCFILTFNAVVDFVTDIVVMNTKICLMFMGPCIVIYFYSKTNKMHNFQVY